MVIRLHVRGNKVLKFLPVLSLTRVAPNHPTLPLSDGEVACFGPDISLWLSGTWLLKVACAIYHRKQQFGAVTNVMALFNAYSQSRHCARDYCCAILNIDLHHWGVSSFQCFAQFILHSHQNPDADADPLWNSRLSLALLIQCRMICVMILATCCGLTIVDLSRPTALWVFFFV